MIYFLRVMPDGPVKVGWTTNLPGRVRTIQTGAAGKLEAIRTIDAPQWVEAWLHQQFAPYRLHGEWFTFHPDMLSITPPTQQPRASYPKGGLIHLRIPPEMQDEIANWAAIEERTFPAMFRRLLREGIKARVSAR